MTTYAEADEKLRPGKSTIAAVKKKAHIHLSELFEELYNDPEYQCVDIACILRTTSGKIQKWKREMIAMGFDLVDRHKNAKNMYAVSRASEERDAFNEYRGW